MCHGTSHVPESSASRHTHALNAGSVEKDLRLYSPLVQACHFFLNVSKKRCSVIVGLPDVCQDKKWNLWTLSERFKIYLSWVLGSCLVCYILLGYHSEKQSDSSKSIYAYFSVSFCLFRMAITRLVRVLNLLKNFTTTKFIMTFTDCEEITMSQYVSCLINN